MPASLVQAQNLSQVSTSSLMRSPRIHRPNSQNDSRLILFLAAIRSNPALLPLNPTVDTINSQRIDNIAHAMWQAAFNNSKMMNDVTAKASMFSQLKLRTLAKLNYLPSWWFIREMAYSVMQSQEFNVDDREMQVYWKETLEWCSRVETRMGVQGDNTVKAVPTEQERAEKLKS